MATRPGFTPAQRARILTAHDHAGIGCGSRPPGVELTLEHIISREIAEYYGIPDALIDSEWNLAGCARGGHRWVSEPQVPSCSDA